MRVLSVCVCVCVFVWVVCMASCTMHACIVCMHCMSVCCVHCVSIALGSWRLCHDNKRPMLLTMTISFTVVCHSMMLLLRSASLNSLWIAFRMKREKYRVSSIQLSLKCTHTFYTVLVNRERLHRTHRQTAVAPDISITDNIPKGIIEVRCIVPFLRHYTVRSTYLNEYISFSEWTIRFIQFSEIILILPLNKIGSNSNRMPDGIRYFRSNSIWLCTIAYVAHNFVTV